MLIHPKIFQDLFNNEKRVSKIQHLQYLVYMLLPVLEQINQGQNMELELEAKLKGTGDALFCIFKGVLLLISSHCIRGQAFALRFSSPDPICFLIC